MKSLVFLLFVLGQTASERPATHPGLHAHNDYYHKKPLIEALELGFDSVEADVFLSKDDLLIGHFSVELRPERSLKKLYLEPLAKMHEAKTLKPMWLLVDIKSADGVAAAKLLSKQLEEFPGLFCRWDKDVPDKAPVKVILSGNMPIAWVKEQSSRQMCLDGREPDLGIAGKTGVTPWVSEPWTKHFTFKGKGEMPADQKEKLKAMASKAKAAGQQLRLWGAPDTPDTWKAQRDAGVQRIGTDKLADLKKYMDKKGTN